MSRSDPPTDLPVPAETAHTYLRVRPSEDDLDPDAVETHFRRLHKLGTKREGLLSRRPKQPDPATLECLLTSNGGPNPEIRYAFATEEAHLDALQRLLRGVFSDTYEFERITETPAFVTAAFETEVPAAVEFYGSAERRADWQTRLTQFKEFSEDGKSLPPVGIVVYVQEVDDRKANELELENREQKFRAVFEGAFDAMVIADDDGVYVDANPAACDLFGLPKDELVGRSIEEFAPEDFDFEAA